MWKEERVSERMYKRKRERERVRRKEFCLVQSSLHVFSSIVFRDMDKLYSFDCSWWQTRQEERRGIVMGDRKSDGMERKGFFDEEG